MRRRVRYALERRVQKLEAAVVDCDVCGGRRWKRILWAVGASPPAAPVHCPGCGRAAIVVRFHPTMAEVFAAPKEA
jgi:hypothetical protein